jgi:hypothetical protein
VNSTVQDKGFKVVCTPGVGRSGSTIIGRVLGQVEGFFTIGELRHIAKNVVIDNWSCGCGKPLQSCDVWIEVFRKAFGGFDGLDAQRFMRLQKRYMRTDSMLMMAAGLEFRTRTSGFRELIEMYDAFYPAIAEVTGAKVLVDTTKYPSHSYILARYGRHPVSLVHLVRDGRAAAHSLRRKKVLPDSPTGQLMPRSHPAPYSFYWMFRNLLVERFIKLSGAPHIFLRYEDFAAEPKKELLRILELAGQTEAGLPFVDDHTVQLGTDHSMGGNPVRMKTGEVELREDREWTEKASFSTKLFATVVGYPALKRYGYL